MCMSGRSAQRSGDGRHVDGRWKRCVALPPSIGDPPGTSRSSRYPPASHHPANTAADDPREVLDLTERVVARPHLVLHLLDAVQGRGVVAPPKFSPILMSESPVHSRIRYIAMCRACVSGRDRYFETRSPVDSWKYVAVSSRISGGGISCSV